MKYLNQESDLAKIEKPRSSNLMEFFLYIELLDVDATVLWSSCLRHNDAEDAVLQAGLDLLLIDTVREGECSGELAN